MRTAHDARAASRPRRRPRCLYVLRMCTQMQPNGCLGSGNLKSTCSALSSRDTARHNIDPRVRLDHPHSHTASYHYNRSWSCRSFAPLAPPIPIRGNTAQQVSGIPPHQPTTHPAGRPPLAPGLSPTRTANRREREMRGPVSRRIPAGFRFRVAATGRNGLTNFLS